MTYTGRVLSILPCRSSRRRAEVEIVEIKPWSYQVKARTVATFGRRLEIAPGDIVEIKTKSPGFRILRHSHLSKLAAVATLLAVMTTILVFYTQEANERLLLILLPIAWACVFGGKLLALRAYLRRVQN